MRKPWRNPASKRSRTAGRSFVPEQFSRVYFQWMRNIQPWCISRQLWWGHQVPVWYGPDGEIFVEETERRRRRPRPRAHYGEPTALRRDTDVLDTWFSSALWPFSTLGWPDETPELARYYPGSVLVTGEDIIFFWGRPDDDDGHAFHARRGGRRPGSLRRRLHPRAGARTPRGRNTPSPRAMSSIRST